MQSHSVVICNTIEIPVHLTLHIWINIHNQFAIWLVFMKMACELVQGDDIACPLTPNPFLNKMWNLFSFSSTFHPFLWFSVYNPVEVICLIFYANSYINIKKFTRPSSTDLIKPWNLLKCPTIYFIKILSWLNNQSINCRLSDIVNFPIKILLLPPNCTAYRGSNSPVISLGILILKDKSFSFDHENE